MIHWDKCYFLLFTCPLTTPVSETHVCTAEHYSRTRTKIAEWRFLYNVHTVDLLKSFAKIKSFFSSIVEISSYETLMTYLMTILNFWKDKLSVTFFLSVNNIIVPMTMKNLNWCNLVKKEYVRSICTNSKIWSFHFDNFFRRWRYFILESCKNSNVCKNIEKLFSPLDSSSFRGSKSLFYNKLLEILYNFLFTIFILTFSNKILK